MREAKYRAWDKIAKPNRMKTWEQLLAQYQLTLVFTSKDFELMQFTGQNDKNGIEIYESDILRDSRKRKFIVTWNNDIGNWVNKPTDNGTSYPCFNIGTVKGLEVVGNIYDNPELLESEVN